MLLIHLNNLVDIHLNSLVDTHLNNLVDTRNIHLKLVCF
jgi:hypothetical protein